MGCNSIISNLEDFGVLSKSPRALSFLSRCEDVVNYKFWVEVEGNSNGTEGILEHRESLIKCDFLSEINVDEYFLKYMSDVSLFPEITNHADNMDSNLNADDFSCCILTKSILNSKVINNALSSKSIIIDQEVFNKYFNKFESFFIPVLKKKSIEYAVNADKTKFTLKPIGFDDKGGVRSLIASGEYVGVSFIEVSENG